jgi:hypothetical protein
MLRTRVLIAALALGCASVALAPRIPQAAVVSPGQSMTIAHLQRSLAEPVAWRRCVYWRHECAHRWGWGNWRWRRCLIWHGCL